MIIFYLINMKLVSLNFFNLIFTHLKIVAGCRDQQYHALIYQHSFLARE